MVMVNNAPCKIIGIRNIRIKIFDVTTKTLNEVRCVPNLKRNLISLNTLDSKEYMYNGECEVLKVSKVAHVVLQGQKMSQLYVS